jgi:hypothetical protein
MYAEAIQDAIWGMGHLGELVFANFCDVIHQVRITMLFEEQKRQELDNEPALERGPESEKFVQDFLLEHDTHLSTGYGGWTSNEVPYWDSYCHIYFEEPSTLSAGCCPGQCCPYDSRKTYLFSAYVNTANGAIAPLGFGMLFGNEDRENWKKFGVLSRAYTGSLASNTERMRVWVGQWVSSLVR